MAGRPSHDELIGVGTALQKAREHRRLTLDEAARDTKLRIDQLRALEDENFDALGGEVYARAALRTYAAYLGLNTGKVMGVYARHADEPEPPPPPGKTGRVERAIAATRVRDNQRFLLIAAAAVIFVLIVFGLLSRDHAAPTAATIVAETPSLAPTDQSFDATLMAEGPTHVTVTVDGEATTYAMAKGEVRSFVAADELTIQLADGSAVQVVVAGRDFGTPSAPGIRWTHTFTYEEISGWPSPSASASATSSGTVSSSPTSPAPISTLPSVAGSG
jgi:Helix-turn-helix domain